VTNNPEDFWRIAEAGARKGEKEFDVKVLFELPNPGTPEKQKEIIDDLMSQKVKAIAISVNNPEGQLEYLDRIADQIPLITQDNDAPKSKRVCYIGTDNYEAGLEVGNLIKKALPDGGTVAIFVGRPDALNAQQRSQGVLDALAGQKGAKGPTLGKYKLHKNEIFYDYASREAAKKNADDVLTALQGEKDVCLIGLWAYNPPAILNAVEHANKLGQVKIVGFDENFATLAGIEKGHIFATVVQQPFEFGYQSVRMMAKLAKGDRSLVPADGILNVPHRVIRQNDAREFSDWLKGILNK